MIQALILLFIQSVFAAPSASDSNYSYCNDLTQIEALKDLSGEPITSPAIKNNSIERIVISKDRRTLYLISQDSLVRSYPVAFGFNPYGHKQFEGDGKTPEGIYKVELKNPKSEFYKALKVSYPNQADIAFAKSQGKNPGGDIMIHGLPVNPDKRKWVYWIHPYNWTRGCMAVTDKQIDEIYSLVKENTLVEICKATPPEDLNPVLIPGVL